MKARAPTVPLLFLYQNQDIETLTNIRLTHWWECSADFVGYLCLALLLLQLIFGLSQRGVGKQNRALPYGY